jgi:hypothetical protein
VRDAFANVPRPAELGRGTCRCEECAEHEQTLASHTPETITLAELGNPGWDPMCFANDAAFAWYMPAMVRFALTTDLYIDQLCFHLALPSRADALTAEQTGAVRDALWAYVEATPPGELDCCDARAIEDALRKLDERLATSG